MSVENVPLAIIGIGCLFPRANGHRAYWANIKHGVDTVGPIPTTHWNPDDYFDQDPKAPDMTYAARGAFLDPYDFNPLEFGISPVDLEATDTSQLLGLVAARQALQDAGYGTDKKFDRNRVSVILGVTGTLELVIPLGARLGHPKWRQALKEAGIDDETAKNVVAKIADSYVPWQENSFPGLLGNVVAGRIANKLDLGGTNCVVDAACASSLSAVHLAGLELAAGRCDVAVTGGVDTFNDIFMYMCFSKTPALSKSGNAKPFSADGDGTILGEGLGMVVLKRLADAERDKDKIYAVIKAIGTSSDGKGNAVYAPSAEGQMRCLRTAYRQAEISPATVELVEAHGTGTKVGDTVEATALAEVFNQTRRAGTWCAVGSVKSMIGHTKAAAGAAGLIKAALALHHKVLPPTLKVTQPVEPLQPGKSPLYVNLDKRPWLPRAEHPRRAGLSAFGFGGSNFHAILEEHSPKKKTADWDGTIQLLCCSGNTVDDVRTTLDQIPMNGTWWEFSRYAAETRARFQTSHQYRLIAVIHVDENPQERIKTIKDKLQSTPNAAWSQNDGCYYGVGPTVGKLAVLFPGQGSQYTGMLREMACTFPEMLDALTLADKGRPFGERLAEAIYPYSPFDDDQRRANELALRATDVAQPAIGAVSVGAWETLESFGLKSDLFAGHSYGELVALWAAGTYDTETLHKISTERGRLMAELNRDQSGGMLAVFATLDQIDAMLSEAKLDIVCANRNSPSQGVLSGSIAEIAKAETICQQHGYRTTRLPVSAAFHSNGVAQASIPLREFVSTLKFVEPAATVVSNRDGNPYLQSSVEGIKDQLAQQLAEPVNFVAQVNELFSLGARTFLEVGPGQVLSKLAHAILADQPEVQCISVDASSGRKRGLWDLAVALARIAARGHEIDITKWEQGQQYPLPTAKPGLTVPICGANYVRPKSAKPKVDLPKPVAREAVQVPSVKPILSPTISPPNVPLAGPKPPMSQHEPNRITDPAALQSALGLTQQSLLAFQRMQEETARLHQQFLSNQQAALATLHALVNQQQAMTNGAALPPLPIAPVYTPPPAVPVYTQPPAVYSLPAPATPVYTPPPVSTNAPTPVAFVPTVQPKPVAIPTPVLAKTSNADASQVLLNVVAEKTGYPVDMLGLEMQLDADLGIDSIKRVEILSALQEKLPNAPTVKPEHLGTLHTLRDITNFLSEVPATATPPAPVAAIAPVSTSPVGDVLLSVVAEKTGYPSEMLGLDMQLDADLGIDSIKRVEILSALQEKLPNAPTVKPEHLGTLHTLRDIATLLAGPIPTGSTSPIVPATEPQLPFVVAITPASAESDRQPSASDSKLAYENLPPTPIPELPPTAYQNHSKIGVSTDSSTHDAILEPPASIFLAPASLPNFSIPEPPELDATSSTTVICSVPTIVLIDPTVERKRITTDRYAPVWIIAEPSSLTATISRQFDAVGLRPQFIAWNDSPYAYEPRGLAGLVLIAPEENPPDDLVIRAFRWLKRSASALNESARNGGSFFATVTRLDGQFGFGQFDSKRYPEQGAFAGLSKTASHEWTGVNCKAIDIDPANARNLVQQLVDEILLRGPLEVGLSMRGRMTLELVDQEIGLNQQRPLPLKQGDVVVVSGGARGVTAESLFPLIREVRPKLVILGRTSLASQEPEWLVNATDEAQIKKALLARPDKPASPKALSEAIKRVLAEREVRQNLRRFSEAGATVQYIVADVQNAVNLTAALADVRRTFGPISAIIHGAGVLADRKIEDLNDDQFLQVYNTKVQGLKNLLVATEDDPINGIVLFSSSTGRFGRLGQVAYAAANEVLNKTAQLLHRTKPTCRTVALNWGPWEGGMVTPALAKVFHDEGIGLIPYSIGGAILAGELRNPSKPVEVVVIAKPSSTVQTPQQPTALPTPPEETPKKNDLPIVLERHINLFDHQVLRSHVLNENAVVPLALHAEWLAHAAMHGNPGLKYFGINDLRVFQPISLDERSPISITLHAGTAKPQQGGFSVPVEIRSNKNMRPVIHSRAEVILVNQMPIAPQPSALPDTGPYSHSIDDAYEYYLFHGHDMRALLRVDGISDTGVVAYGRSAPEPTAWMDQPVRNQWLGDPLLMDAAFQMMILWSNYKHQRGSLPCFVGEYRQYQRSFPTEAVLLALKITKANNTIFRADIELIDQQGKILATLMNVEHVIDANLNEVFRKGRLSQTSGHSTHASRFGG